jgi:fibronectin-binding autotransporter adhesin
MIRPARPSLAEVPLADLSLGSLTNNGRLIVNRSNASTYSGVLSGSGAVTKRGAGQLTLAGANAYSGLTTISAGTIALSGTGSIGTGGGSVILGGVLNLAFSGGTYADGADVLQISANTGGLSGTFSAVNFTGLGAGQSATFNAATGFITVVPEPSTFAAVFAGLACGFLFRCRNRSR